MTLDIIIMTRGAYNDLLQFLQMSEKLQWNCLCVLCDFFFFFFRAYHSYVTVCTQAYNLTTCCIVGVNCGLSTSCPVYCYNLDDCLCLLLCLLTYFHSYISYYVVWKLHLLSYQFELALAIRKTDLKSQFILLTLTFKFEWDFVNDIVMCHPLVCLVLPLAQKLVRLNWFGFLLQCASCFRKWWPL